MRTCSVCRNLQVVHGGKRDYEQLAAYHYRDRDPLAPAAVFALKPTGARAETAPLGVIVYTMPAPVVELRNVATAGLLTGLDNRTRLALLNRTVRCIARVIIEPRLSGLGLATRLVRETLPKAGVPIVEALAVMGSVHPFFERAGMTAYRAPLPVHCVRLIEALSLVGIEADLLLDAHAVQRRLSRLQSSRRGLIQQEIRTFLSAYRRGRDMPAGIERTRYVLSKLTDRPVYYAWFNPELNLRDILSRAGRTNAQTQEAAHAR